MVMAMPIWNLWCAASAREAGGDDIQEHEAKRPGSFVLRATHGSHRSFSQWTIDLGPLSHIGYACEDKAADLLNDQVDLAELEHALGLVGQEMLPRYLRGNAVESSVGKLGGTSWEKKERTRKSSSSFQGRCLCG